MNSVTTVLTNFIHCGRQSAGSHILMNVKICNLQKSYEFLAALVKSRIYCVLALPLILSCRCYFIWLDFYDQSTLISLHTHIFTNFLLIFKINSAVQDYRIQLLIILVILTNNEEFSVVF